MSTTYVYVDEAGRSCVNGGNKNQRQPYFIVGVLLTNDPQRLLDAVGQARVAHHFTNEIHWTKQSDLRARVYHEVAQRIRTIDHWEYRATRFEASAVDLRFFRGRPHLAYNRFVRIAIDNALHSARIAIHSALDLTLDAKTRLHEDDFLEGLRAHYEALPRPDGSLRTSVTVREVASTDHDLVQLCDLLSGAHHTMLTSEHCGHRKAALAPIIWSATHCRANQFDLVRRDTRRKDPY